MSRLRIALPLVLACQFTAAQPPLTATSSQGPTKGLLRVEWVDKAASRSPSQSFDSNYAEGSGVLRVFRVGTTEPLQEFPLDVNIRPDQMTLELIDISGDGTQDLLFHGSIVDGNHRQGLMDVYLWSTKLQRFVRSNALSQRGWVRPLRRKGCVQLQTLCGYQLDSAVSRQTLCFQSTPGRWNTVSAQSCPADR